MTRFSIPEPGQIAVVHQRWFAITGVPQSNFSAPFLSILPCAVADAGHQHLVNLTSIEDDALGETLQVVWTSAQAFMKTTSRSCLPPQKDHRHLQPFAQDPIALPTSLNCVAVYDLVRFQLRHGFHKAAQSIRYTFHESARRKVLARPLALNHERYAEEVKAGLYEKKGKKAKGGAPARASKEKVRQEVERG